MRTTLTWPATLFSLAGCGVIITGNPRWTTDLTAPALGNTFANNAGGDICGP